MRKYILTIISSIFLFVSCVNGNVDIKFDTPETGNVKFHVEVSQNYVTSVAVESTINQVKEKAITDLKFKKVDSTDDTILAYDIEARFDSINKLNLILGNINMDLINDVIGVSDAVVDVENKNIYLNLGLARFDTKVHVPGEIVKNPEYATVKSNTIDFPQGTMIEFEYVQRDPFAILFYSLLVIIILLILGFIGYIVHKKKRGKNETN